MNDMLRKYAKKYVDRATSVFSERLFNRLRPKKKYGILEIHNILCLVYIICSRYCVRTFGIFFPLSGDSQNAPTGTNPKNVVSFLEIHLRKAFELCVSSAVQRNSAKIGPR